MVLRALWWCNSKLLAGITASVRSSLRIHLMYQIGIIPLFVTRWSILGSYFSLAISLWHLCDHSLSGPRNSAVLRILAYSLCWRQCSISWMSSLWPSWTSLSPLHNGLIGRSWPDMFHRSILYGEVSWTSAPSYRPEERDVGNRFGPLPEEGVFFISIGTSVAIFCL